MKDYKNKIISLDKFIENSLYDKRDGYYMSKDPFGKKGDFITSSNVSIFFSEMLAIWILSFWEKLNKPKKINIIDMGGGNGEMSFNILNTLNKFSQFKKNYCFYIHEKSPYLKRKQKFKIKNSSIIWINNLEKIKDGPCLFLANEFFDSFPIKQFLTSFTIPMFLVTCYTLLNHMLHGFSEEAGHWVMWPFFKDHTSYGAILAMTIPISFWLYRNQKYMYAKLFYLFVIVTFLIGLYFSYTRAAWLTMFGGFLVYVLYYFKIKIKWLLSLSIIPLIMILINFNEIGYLLNKNDAEHTTENFSERLESMSNVSTDASNLERLNRWNSAIQLFKERPILGWGPGTYAFVYAPFQDASDLTIISTNFGDGGNAHSEYLGPLSEQGILGLIFITKV